MVATPPKYLRPPLKWAGGKHRVLGEILPRLPKGKRLIEPFLGSAVVFLNADYPTYVVADKNEALVGFYRFLRDDPEELIQRVGALFTDENNESAQFYALRAQFNASTCPKERAVLLFYLNRHAYNGLYRVNSRGIFNVPYGRFKRPKIYEERLRALASKLENASLQHGDFETVMDQAGPGDVVYCDPAYHPLSNTAKFSSYTAGGFGPDGQKRLAECARAACARGATVAISNHNVPFTQDIYAGAIIHEFDVRRTISRDITNRGMAPELLAVFKPKT
ncbi:MAG: DNA adenine methylase [Myxococcota bacterium]|jgi:DNA adenine methylase